MENLRSKLLLYGIFSICFLLASCAPAVKYQSYLRPEQSQKTTQDILVFNKEDVLSGNSKIIGKISVTDTGFSFGCGYDNVLKIAKERARSEGGNAIHILDVRAPDWISGCYRIFANAIVLPELVTLDRDYSAGRISQVDYDSRRKSLTIMTVVARNSQSEYQASANNNEWLGKLVENVAGATVMAALFGAEAGGKYYQQQAYGGVSSSYTAQPTFTPQPMMNMGGNAPTTGGGSPLYYSPTRSVGSSSGQFNPTNPSSEYSRIGGAYNPTNPQSEYTSPSGSMNPNNPQSEVSRPDGIYNPNNPQSEVSRPGGSLNPNNPQSEVSRPDGIFNPNNPQGQGVHPYYYQKQYLQDDDSNE